MTAEKVNINFIFLSFLIMFCRFLLVQNVGLTPKVFLNAKGVIILIIENKFKKKLRIDLKWREMRYKVIFLASNMAAGSHFVKISKQLKLRIDLKWQDMRSKVIFGHPKWPLAAIQISTKKSCVLI